MKKNKTIYPYILSLESFDTSLKEGDVIRKAIIFIKEIDIKYLHDSIISQHKRLNVFSEKGCKCEYCKIEGTRLILTENPFNFSRHIDLYSNELILMTIDHVIPLSKGGKTELNNLVPCCTFCNTVKGKKQDLTVEQIVEESIILKNKFLQQCKKI